MTRILTLFFLAAALTASAQDLYVWHRSYPPALLQEIKQFYLQSRGKLCFLAGELENDGKVFALKPSPAVQFDRAVPVVRIHVKQMQKSPAELAKTITDIYEPWSKCRALQIDLDAPESKLDYYRNLMLELRSRLGKVKLSVTVLPCHIKHTEKFRALALACDYYVLQVHGLSKENGRWFIMDGKIARAAVKQAGKLALPYQLALPLYAHTVEQNLPVLPDLHLAAELAKTAPSVIGFRLAAAGEREALDLASALQILKGKYAPQLDIFWQKQANGAWYLMVRNKGFFPQKISCTFKLPADTVIMDMDVFPGGTLDRLAHKIEFILPPSGTTQACMWLRGASKNNLNMENAFNIKFNPGKISR